MNYVYLELGGNEGDRIMLLDKATLCIKEFGCFIVKESSVYETPPWGFEASRNFYNKVLCVKTKMTPEQLLEITTKIEYKLGRVRGKNRYASRTMDIDILFYNSEIIDTQTLTIPHPRLHKRKFVLEPLNEISPEFQHPVFNKNISALLKECNDTSECKKIQT